MFSLFGCCFLWFCWFDLVGCATRVALISLWVYLACWFAAWLVVACRGEFGCGLASRASCLVRELGVIWVGY